MAAKSRPLTFLGSLKYTTPILALGAASWKLDIPFAVPLGIVIALGGLSWAVRKRSPRAAEFAGFLGSLWFLIPLLVLMAAVLIVVTTPVLDEVGLDFTSGALRKDFYAPVFNILLGLLAINLVTCTVKREPYTVWMWGYLCTHTGVFTIMVGSFLSYNGKRYGQMPVPQGKTVSVYNEEDVRELVVEPRERGAPLHRFLLDENLYRPSEPRKRFSIPEQDLTLSVEKYLPHVEYKPPKYPDYAEGGPPGSPAMAQIQVFMEDEASPGHWLEHEKPDRFPGSPLLVVFKDVDEEEARTFLQPVGPKGVLVLTAGRDRLSLDVETQMGQTARSGGLEATLVSYFPAYRITGSGEVVKDDDPEGKAAVLFEIKQGERSERYWVLEDHSNFALREGNLRDRGDFGVAYRRRLASSAAIFLHTPSGWHYLVTSRKGESASGSMQLGEKVRYPFMQFRLELQVIKYVSRGHLVVHPRQMQAGDQAHQPALFVRLTSQNHESWGWLPFGTAESFKLGDRTIRMMYRPREEDCFGLEITLREFRKVDHPGTEDARAFESDVELHDRKTGIRRPYTISVNNPLVHNGIVFYQAFYRFEEDGTPVSIYQVLKDPGKNIVYLGVLVTISGTIYMFYLRGLLFRLMRGMQGATDVPLTGLSQLGFLMLGTVGTLAAFALTAFKALPLLGVVGIFLLANVLGIVIEILLAIKWSAAREARRMGQAFSAWFFIALGIAGLFLVFRASPAATGAIFFAGLVLGAVLIGLATRPTPVASPGRAAQLGQLVACSWLINTAGLIVLLMAGVS